MDSSKNGRWIIPFKKFCRLRVTFMLRFNTVLFVDYTIYIYINQGKDRSILIAKILSVTMNT